MAKGVGASTAVASTLLEADDARVGLDIQVLSGSETFIAFGEDAVDATGLSLVVATRPALPRITDVRCKQRVSIVNAAAGTSVVGYDRI